MDPDSIETVAVTGAGTMGHGIAEVAALAGYEVRLRDVERELVRDGYERIEWSLEKLAEKGRVDDAERDAALDRITPVVDVVEAVEGADLVIEAVVEDADVKRQVYADVCEHLDDEALVATNTSSLSVTDLAESTDRPEQFCGLHFFNPAVRMELVEVVAGEHTSAATLETAEAVAESLDKTPVRVRKDTPGFVVNRVLVPLMNEAAWLVHDGAADVETVDSTAAYGIGLPMGALELADMVGVDVTLAVLERMRAGLGAAYEPCPLVRETVEDGNLGRKSGQGFYDYDDGDPAVPADAVDESVERRLLGVMADETARLLAADVADAGDVDRAVELGGGFPDGPAKLADEHGVGDLVDALETAHEATGHDRYAVSDHLRSVAERGGFHADDADGTEYDTLAVEVDAEAGVGHLTLDRTHRMNSISVALLDELDAAIDRLAEDDRVRAVLVRGAGDRAFSAGADVTALVDAEPVEAVELSRKGQRVFGEFREIDEPVIAAIDGFCLGGGMELATCADLRVATPRSRFGQTEHTLGLLPGWGGTQRLQRLVGEARAKEIVFTAERFDAERMREYGFLAEVVDADAVDDRAAEMAADLAAGPPVAQRYTKRAMHRGQEDAAAGLELEAQAFGHVVGTEDVTEGVSAFMDDREPEFEGR
ncbi:3-hydroxyacyl-CoA dehydrogenase [Halobacteriales archaeon SW_5_70_135]|nr:MAG: 3-hydroxyacyl-CoA dehydrogenase [Halobacteriales archaeon SW_5_70_135]